MVFKATFNNVSVLLVEKTAVLPQVTDKLDQIIIFFNIPSIARIYITLDAKFAGCLHYPGEQNLTILGSFKYILFLI